MTAFVIALIYLKSLRTLQFVIRMKPKQILAKVLAAKLEYLSKKQFGFASGPWMLVSGMLLRVSKSARKS
jgi:hypothetical protein